MALPELPRMAGLVLAGGQSSRMGRDKALLPWQGRPLLVHMRDLLVAAGADPVRISGDYPHYQGLADRVPGAGPLGGLDTAMATLPEGPAWVVPVDMPLLDVALLHRLRDAPPAACVIFAGQPLPMRLHVDARSRHAIAALLGDPNGRRSLQALQHVLGTCAVPLPADDASRLANCNTPADWDALNT